MHGFAFRLARPYSLKVRTSEDGRVAAARLVDVDVLGFSSSGLAGRRAGLNAARTTPTCRPRTSAHPAS
jgi:hypothetical protein